MSRYTLFLPAPSFSELQRNATRAWVVEDHVLDIPEGEDTSHEPHHGMEIDRREDKESDTQFSSVLDFREPSNAREEEPSDDSGALIFSQNVSKLYEGAIFNEEELAEAYAFSQIDEISKDSEAYDWSESIIRSMGSTQVSMAHLSQSVVHGIPPSSSYPVGKATQDTSMEEESSADVTRDSSDASIQRLPTFRIPIHQLSSLKQLMQPLSAHAMSDSRKVNLLVGLLDVNGPDYIRLKKGVDAGQEVALLKLLMGGADGAICKVTVWRELAEEWGGMLSRGDVTLFQDILFSENTNGTGSFTASKNTKSVATVCYRTIPLTPEDKQLRPDLRLAAFDPAIAKVAQVVRWLQQMGGLSLEI